MNEFSVQYLSPLVVRKEIENIIVNRSKETVENCVFDSKFIEEHSVIFWNLIWYAAEIHNVVPHGAFEILHVPANILRIPARCAALSSLQWPTQLSCSE